MLNTALRRSEKEFAEAVSHWADEALVQQLIEQLKGLPGRDPAQRRRLITALSYTASPDAAVAVADWLGKDSAARDAMLALGITAELHLLRILRMSDDNSLKRTVIGILHETGSQRSLSPLIALGRIPSHPLARPAAKAVLAIQKRLQSQ